MNHFVIAEYLGRYNNFYCAIYILSLTIIQVAANQSFSYHTFSEQGGFMKRLYVLLFHP